MKSIPPSRRCLVRLAALLIVAFSLGPVAAQAPSPDQTQSAPSESAQARPAKSELPVEVADNVTRLTAAIETAEKTIQHLAELEEELGGLRVDVETILDDSSQTAETLRPQLAAVRSQIDKLGPPPGKDGPAEAPALAAERARLTALAAGLDGAIKSTELTWVRARQLIEKITVLRHSLFAKNLMERRPSPLLPDLWRDLMSKAPPVGNRISYLADDWLRWASIKRLKVGLLLGAVVILFIALRMGLGRLTDRRQRRSEPPPSFFERAMSVAWVAPMRALPSTAAALLLYAGLDAMDLLFPPWGVTAAGVLKAVVLYAAVSALIFAMLAPRAPQWRLVSLADGPTRPVAALLCAITALYAIDGALTEISRVFFVPLALTVVQTFGTSIAFAALLIGLLLTPFTPQPAETAAAAEVTTSAASAVERYPRHAPRWLKLPLWLIALAILGLALFGYVALARFVAQQLVLTGIVLVVSWLLYLAIRAVTREPQQRRYPVGELLEARFGLDAPRRNQLARLTEIALTFALVICALPFLMLQWGFSGADIRDWFKSLFFGIEVGQFRISLARILLGIVLFIVLLFATRLLQRWLREKALQQTRMDPGIANSVDTVVGYIGVSLAALLAVSYAGVDITNLAIVAGALSVGIGFGLQSIVNNFVSGLILLIERPIKVGDRIVVGDQQGLVRRISVRATEIETFDRASLIVPNSELITGRVLNWTHRDSLGAVNVKVGVGYNSDPEQVLALLKTCADDHPDVLRTPAPMAFFDNFGDSALLFTLRISLPDIAQAGRVQSDLRTAILKALRAAEIEIPFNQLDVNLRELDGVKGYFESQVQKGADTARQPAEPETVGASNGKRLRGAAE
jgi:potassium-dependent mechanosensitive channel